MSGQQFDGALHVMEVQGGSFVKSLAACYYAADSSSKAKLRAAFADYFLTYEKRFSQYLNAKAASPATGGEQGS